MSRLVALDVGTRRIGIATASPDVGIASVMTTLINDDSFDTQFQVILDECQPLVLVVGLPRNLDGDDTPQTAYVRQFALQLEQRYGIPIILQDEALTSHKAKVELDARGKHYEKAAIDALSAVYILEDYLKEQK